MRGESRRPALPVEAYEHYAESGYEARRLETGMSRLELARTRQILEEVLPPPPARIVDAAGGAGAYACWLARRGYRVDLVDAVDLHVELARRASAAQPDAPLASAEVGDARRLPQADAAADAVLLMGPIDSGQHRNPTGNPAYFTTAYFHHPRELAEEIVEAGLEHDATLAVEGPGWLLQDFERHGSDPERKSRLLALMRRLEREPSLLGVSSHLVGIGRRPG